MTDDIVETEFRALARAALRVGAELGRRLSEEKRAELGVALANGGSLYLEFGPIGPEFDRAVLVLIAADGRRCEVNRLQVNGPPPSSLS